MRPTLGFEDGNPVGVVDVTVVMSGGSHFRVGRYAANLGFEDGNPVGVVDVTVVMGK